MGLQSTFNHPQRKESSVRLMFCPLHQNDLGAQLQVVLSQIRTYISHLHVYTTSYRAHQVRKAVCLGARRIMAHGSRHPRNYLTLTSISRCRGNDDDADGLHSPVDKRMRASSKDSTSATCICDMHRPHPASMNPAPSCTVIIYDGVRYHKRTIPMGIKRFLSCTLHHFGERCPFASISVDDPARITRATNQGNEVNDALTGADPGAIPWISKSSSFDLLITIYYFDS